MTTGDEATIFLPKGSEPPAPGKTCPLCGGTFPSDFVVCPKDASPLGEPRKKDDDPLIGIVLAGTYRVCAALGEGGMGRLYEAEHLRLDRRFAVKVIQESFGARQDLVARFEREARAMSRVKSDHVVDVVDVLRVPDGRPCIVCELLDGEDLEQLLDRSGKLPLGEAVALTRQACAGLAAAHAQGVVHRDLKPSNLFLATNAGGGTTLKILDFGVAKVAGEVDTGLTHTGAVVGTPAYMAPEQARGSANVDARSDVYALGAVLYRMLTGRPPYAGEDASTTLATVLERDPTRPRTIDRAIPEGMELLVQQAMARDPEARLQTIDELDRGLVAFDPAGEGRLARGSQLTTQVAETVAKKNATVATMVGTRADAKGAARITQRARFVRPGAVFAMLLATLAAGAATAAALGLLVTGLRRGEPLATTDVVLVLLAAGVALLATGVGTGRALRAAWDAAPRVEAFAARVYGGVGAAVATLGASELVVQAIALARLSPGATSPLVSSARVATAALAGLVAGWIADRSRGR